MTVPAKQRLLALDVMRGITIAGMILVNNPGSWSNIYTPLEHAQWNGLTPTDLVFPFFMFIMGVSTSMSLRRYGYQLTGAAAAKIIRRGIVIFAIGIAIAWLGLFLKGVVVNEKNFVDAALCFGDIRILGVMPRLAICYTVGAIAALLCTRRWVPWLVVALLVVYSGLLIVGQGYEISTDNWLYRLDMAVLGENHLYGGTETDGVNTIQFDPEGILSTLPSIAHMLIGYLCGFFILEHKDNTDRICRLFIVGTVLTFAGLLLSYGLPINKKVWSPTFVLTTCGLASSLLALLIWIIDIRGFKAWSRPFEVFGINPLFLYCLGAVASLMLGYCRVGGRSIKGIIYKDCLVPLCGGDATLASLVFALCLVCVCWLIGLILYKKKIYIKI